MIESEIVDAIEKVANPKNIQNLQKLPQNSPKMPQKMSQNLQKVKILEDRMMRPSTSTSKVLPEISLFKKRKLN